MSGYVLFVMLQIIVACVISCICIIVSLATGFISYTAIVFCVAIGFVIAIPLAWVIFRCMMNSQAQS